jgi:hypothetical protein
LDFYLQSIISADIETTTDKVKSIGEKKTPHRIRIHSTSSTALRYLPWYYSEGKGHSEARSYSAKTWHSNSRKYAFP